MNDLITTLAGSPCRGRVSVDRAIPVVARGGFLILLSLVASGASAQDITYNFVNYPADQTDIATGQQDAISGYITTDGSMGLLSPSDIVSWSFTINRGTAGSLGPYTYTGSNLTSGTLSPGMAQMILVGGPVATPTQLVLYGDYQSVSQGYFDGCELGLYYGIDSGDIYAANLNYFNSPGYYEHYLGTIDTTGAVSIAGWNTVSPEMNGSQPWVIATATPTPEPSTLLLLAASATGLVGYGFWRRRVTKRTAKPTHFDQPQENDPTILSFPSHSFHEATVMRRVA